MSVSAHSSHPPLPPVIERYRRSWLNHNISELTELFDDTFEYVIKGETRFSDKKALRNYWCKNKLRQKDLSIYMRPVDGTHASAFFSALFYHPVRLAITQVTGVMEIGVNANGDRIVRVDEVYDKIEKFNPFYSLQIFYEVFLSPVARIMARILRPVWGVVEGFAKNFLVIAFVFGIFLVAYVNFIHASFHLLPDQFASSAKKYLPMWFAAGFILQQAIPWFRRGINPDLEIKGFESHQDLVYMADVMESADDVQIVSGDFSFIDTNPRLENCLRHLAFSRKLRLISYKSQAIVREEMAVKSSSNDIFLKLQDEGRIHFDFPVKAKITLVEHGGMKKMLFRFNKDVNGSNKLHMGFIKESANTAALLDVLERFLSAGVDEKLTVRSNGRAMRSSGSRAKRAPA